MKYNPDIHHRRSIRLKGYDYSRAGLFFITICTQNRDCVFGEIENGEMVLNDAGRMAKKWWNELNHKYPNIELHEQVAMPNHFHGIIQIKSPVTAPVGADLRVCPETETPDVWPAETRQSSQTGQSQRIAPTDMTKSGEHASVEHIGSPLHRMIQWFKTMTTNEYIRGVKNKNWKRFDKKLWQRNYYEHIIRDEKSYYQISEYIQTNPLKWQDDKYYA